MQAFQDIFISYGRRDSLEFATQLNHRLVKLGFTVWFDYDDIPLGVDYQKQIDDGIEHADNFLFIISPHSINSPYCKLELELALKYRKRIIPLLQVEKISYQTWQERNPDQPEAAWIDYQAKGLHDSFQNMHSAIQKINWVYMRAQDDFEAEFIRLLQIFDLQKDYVHQHTVLLTKALTWERQQKQPLYLLIGEDRLAAETWLKQRFKGIQPPCNPTTLHCEFITESRKNANNLMTEVFLAYAEEDRTTAGQIRNSLLREGFTVWMNTTDIQAGAEFQRAIEQGIEEADNLVYLLSAAALRSPWCQRELDYALSLHKRVIPVRVEAIAPAQIPPPLQNLQYIDLTDNSLESDYQQDESQLIHSLRQDAAYHERHKLLLTKALRWERQHRNPAMLLRGYNLRHAENWLKVAQRSSAYPPLPLQAALIAASLRQPPGGSLDVFISYSRADSGFARKLNEALQIQGKRTWFDQESIAAGTPDFQQEIHRGIESADICLFILSPRSVNSPYCADEVEYAASLNKRLVTLLHQAVDPARLHPQLAKVQWLDFNQYEGDFSANFTELLHILNTDGTYLQAHTHWLLKAIEWDKKGRKESLLLRDDELTEAEGWLALSVGKDPQPTQLQQTYIANSRLVENAHRQATQILTSAAIQAKRQLWMAAGVSTLLLLLAGFVTWQGWIKNQVAETKLKTLHSSEQLLSGQTFQALLTALEVGQELKTKIRMNSPAGETLQPQVMGVLLQAIDAVRERNSLTGHQAPVMAVSISPDGKILASADEKNLIKLWDIKTGQELHTLNGQKEEIYTISFSPDGQILATAGRQFGEADKAAQVKNSITLWDVETGKELHTLPGHFNRINSLQFSPDGKFLASAGHDNQIKLWNLETKEVEELTGHGGAVTSLSFHPKGHTLASASDDETIRLWSLETRDLIQSIKADQEQISSIAFSSDGKTLASAGFDHTIKLWDAPSGTLIQTLKGHRGAVTSLSFSRDGKVLASASLDRTIKLWDTTESNLLLTLSGHQALIWSVSFSPDGKTLASASEDKTVKLWDTTISNPSHWLKQHTKGVMSVSFSPDGKTLASAGLDGQINLWDGVTGNKRYTLQNFEDPKLPQSNKTRAVYSVSFSSDGRILAAADESQTIQLWDPTTGQPLSTLESNLGKIHRVSFSPQGMLLAATTQNGSIQLWDGATGRALPPLKGEPPQKGAIGFSPDGKLLVAGNENGTIQLWDTTTWRLVRELKGEPSQIQSVSFSRDGKLLAAGNENGTIQLWDTTAWRFLRELKGHQGTVWSVSFNPDPSRKILVSAGEDNSLRFWDWETGKELVALYGHGAPVFSVSFSPDGKTVASGSRDTSVRLWTWDFDRLMTTGCTWIKPYLDTQANKPKLCQPPSKPAIHLPFLSPTRQGEGLGSQGL